MTLHTKAAFLAACAVLAHRPADLTDDEVAILGECRPEIGRDAQAARTRAREAIAERQRQHDQRLAQKTAQAQARGSGLSQKTLEALAAAIRKHVYDPLDARIAALEAAQRGTATPPAPPEKPHVKFWGLHTAHRAYAVGDAVTVDRDLWVCAAPTTTAPGVDGLAWRRVA